MLVFVPSLVLSQTSIEGKISDQESGEPIIYGTVALYKNGDLITVTETDDNGNYSISNIDPGTYDINASYVGYQAKTVEGVILLAGKNTRVDIEISSGTVLDQVVIVEYKVPLVEQDNTTTGGIVTGEQIRNLPMKNINSLAATASGVSSFDGESVAIRGSRTNATDYYVDGIRVSANMVPQTAARGVGIGPRQEQRAQLQRHRQTVLRARLQRRLAAVVEAPQLIISEVSIP